MIPAELLAAAQETSESTPWATAFLWVAGAIAVSYFGRQVYKDKKAKDEREAAEVAAEEAAAAESTTVSDSDDATEAGEDEYKPKA
ncbi:hypothetical protein [Demequina flava]|uniref:hypothetical protein n=1 Tax=Demequina flava TaxID=1095025 RepID=UPI000781880E|nr:hypothetical protein [Demequina flava]